MKSILFATISLLFLLSCTAQQRNWRDNTYLDIAAGVTKHYEETTTSAGVSYPIWSEIWGTVGLWNDFYGNWGEYWGISYAWAPFAKEESEVKKAP